MQKFVHQGTINSQDLLDVLKNRADQTQEFVLVDVREEGEYNMAHLKGVDMLKPLSTQDEWEDTLFEELKNKVVIFTCYTGSRSGDIQEVFKKRGHTQVINHIGGIASYRGEIVR